MCVCVGGISHFTLYSATLKRKSLQDPKTHWVLTNNLHDESGDGHSEKALRPWSLISSRLARVTSVTAVSVTGAKQSVIWKDIYLIHTFSRSRRYHPHPTFQNSLHLLWVTGVKSDILLWVMGTETVARNPGSKDERRSRPAPDEGCPSGKLFLFILYGQRQFMTSGNGGTGYSTCCQSAKL